MSTLMIVLGHGGYLAIRGALGEEFLNTLETSRERGIGTAIVIIRRICGDVYTLPLNSIPSFKIRPRYNTYS